jgi:hypothetical protein
MITLSVRYKFNPDKIAGIRNYFENEQRVIERSGGRTVGCFLPTDFAGPTDEAIWLIDLPSMAAYETTAKCWPTTRSTRPTSRGSKKAAPASR